MVFGGRNSESNKSNGDAAYQSLLGELSRDGKNGKNDGLWMVNIIKLVFILKALENREMVRTLIF